MKIDIVPITTLLPDPLNSRKHDRKNIDAIKASIAKFDQVEPLIVQKSTNIVIGGNGRLIALRELGMTSVCVHFVDVDNTQARALSTVLNRTSELAAWDEDLLAQHLQALREDDWNLEDLGFYAIDLTKFNSDFNNDLDEKATSEANKKYLLEIEFPDEQALKDEYEILVSQGLIVRFK